MPSLTPASRIPDESDKEESVLAYPEASPSLCRRRHPKPPQLDRVFDHRGRRARLIRLPTISSTSERG